VKEYPTEYKDSVLWECYT